jgi:YbgC/YbaW family acyl-CoA thioester hydrolase
MQQDVKASWHSRHLAKIEAQPSQYLRGMNDIQPYCPEIRFSDVDAYGIVHNAKYLVYMEQARIHWWRQAVGGSAWDWTKIGVLVAHHTIDYLSPVQLGDTLEVSCVAGEVGTKSMDVHYSMSCKGRPVAKAKTVLVCFDHREKRTTSVPQEWRDALERLKSPTQA